MRRKIYKFVFPLGIELERSNSSVRERGKHPTVNINKYYKQNYNAIHVFLKW